MCLVYPQLGPQNSTLKGFEVSGCRRSNNVMRHTLNKWVEKTFSLIFPADVSPETCPCEAFLRALDFNAISSFGRSETGSGYPFSTIVRWLRERLPKSGRWIYWCNGRDVTWNVFSSSFWKFNFATSIGMISSVLRGFLVFGVVCGACIFFDKCRTASRKSREGNMQGDVELAERRRTSGSS